jgi:hypothetical protein
VRASADIALRGYPTAEQEARTLLLIFAACGV